MIQKLSHTSIYVLDQEAAKRFYTEKLGFELRNDITMGGFRWVTVGPKGQSEIEMVLMPTGPGPTLDEAAAAALRGLIQQGAFGCGVLETDDCQATYEELTRKGVAFNAPPTQRPYGLEAVLRDDSGNWFSLVQRPR
jgi:predicted enzyme related to lactoylglutathione lyase